MKGLTSEFGMGSGITPSLVPPGNKIYCYNKNAATRFFQIHNKATDPVNTEVPVESFPVAANSALIIDSTFWGASGRTCSTGVSWAFSTTEATLTLGAAADQTSSVGYL